ncbi:hypothetical protein CUJ83_03480 [Methanocella sp. CWC-04]|uniref:Uncharacterized protein n=1 Tax=Methanooceanicella nereidis TaxID=2052831 RepID=A0AAP2W6F9_9EURY|nr:hypothetical protein [Methanocella sp. CWC-04]MCD1294056.1 hypothetical protein [Methanocella sp. CWC-04]
MSDRLKEILVPCPGCGNIHKVPVKDVLENAHIKMPCGAVIGSAGLMRRIKDAEEKAKDPKPRIYRLDDKI